MCRKISAIELFTHDKGISKLNVVYGIPLALPSAPASGTQILWKA